MIKKVFLMSLALLQMLLVTGCAKEAETYTFYDTDVSQVNHYSFDEMVKESDVDFSIVDFKKIEDGKYELTLDGEGDLEGVLNSKYTLSFAINNEVHKLSSQKVENGIFYMIADSLTQEPTQIVLIENKSRENLAVINLPDSPSLHDSSK